VQGGPLKVVFGYRFIRNRLRYESKKIDFIFSASTRWLVSLHPSWSNTISIYGSLYYAPEVTSFTNLDHMYTYEFRVNTWRSVMHVSILAMVKRYSIVYDDNSAIRRYKGLIYGARVRVLIRKMIITNIKKVAQATFFIFLILTKIHSPS